MRVSTVDDASWPTVVGSPGICLVEFWADWCEPCVAVGRTLEEIAAEYGDRLRVAKVDVRTEAALAERAGVLSVPTLVLYEDGRPVRRMNGARNRRQLVEVLGDHLGD